MTKVSHICMLLPKFHCEIIEKLRKNVPDGLDSVSLESIKKHFRKIRMYMFGYLQGIAAGPELENHVKKM